MLAAAIAAAWPAAARAEAVSGAQLRALAARALDDRAALERLRGVDRVDGRPADVEGALRGAVGAELAARLDALAQEPARAGRPLRDPRREARDILAGRRFSPPELPGPFRGVLDRLADWLAPVIGLIPALDGVVPGGRPVVWALLALIVGAGAAAVAIRSLERRGGRAAHGATGASGAIRDDPETLERMASEAAARGDHELALRLAFRAGLLRLDRRGVIELRPSLPTGEVARTLHSDDFDRVAARFEEVSYGGRAAGPADVDSAREGWAAVLRS